MNYQTYSNCKQHHVKPSSVACPLFCFLHVQTTHTIQSPNSLCCYISDSSLGKDFLKILFNFLLKDFPCSSPNLLTSQFVCSRSSISRGLEPLMRFPSMEPTFWSPTIGFQKDPGMTSPSVWSCHMSEHKMMDFFSAQQSHMNLLIF